MSSLPERFHHHVTTHDLLPPRGRIMVAVSGGLDSVVLLNLIATRFPEATIAVAHFDHGWRADSTADAGWVRDLADSYKVDFLTARSEPTSHRESAARTSRYAFLTSAAEAWGADVIATAHHADDQAETVLFRIARGAGTRGLAGIPMRRTLRGQNLRRPLLPFRRPEIESYAAARGIEWREDTTNKDTRHARNRIRHDLLPALEIAAPGTTEQLLAISALAREAEQHWRDELKGALRECILSRDSDSFTLASTFLLGYHLAIRARVLRKLARRLGADLGRTGTRRGAQFISSARSGSAVDLARDIRLAREFDRFVLCRTGVSAMDSGTGNAVAIDSCDVGSAGSAEVVVGGRRVRLRWSVEVAEVAEVAETVRDSAGARTDRIDHDVAFDPKFLTFPLVIRGWQPGDAMRMSYGSKKLKKLFVERRIGRSQRQCVPILAEQESGAVLWLAGIARAAVAAPVNGAPTFRIRIEE